MPTYDIESIRIDPRCQAREALDPETVEEYREHVRAGTDLGQVDLFEVDGDRFLVDGFHRREALIAEGHAFIVGRVVGSGTMEECIWRATAANQHLGLKRSRADKRRAVWLAFETGIGCDQSNGVVAKHIGVSDVFVGAVRKEWEAARSGVYIPPITRKGKDGVRRNAHPERSESRPASEPPEDVLPPAPKPATSHAMPTWGEKLDMHVTVLRSARLRMRTDLPDELGALKSRLEVGLKGFETALAAAIPEVCPACRGLGCAPCERRGWVTGATANEMRARAERRP